MIKYSFGDQISYQPMITRFPAGELGVTLTCNYFRDKWAEAVIEAKIKSSDDLIILLLTVDAIKRKYFNPKLVLVMPYIPYARQDRVCNEGESLSISVLASLINSCGFREVVVLDPHSDVSTALIDNVHVVSQYDTFKRIFTREQWQGITIIAPDAGAYKKAHLFAKAVGAKGVVSCEKVRDLKTGNIVQYRVNGDLSDVNHAVVLDDIVDGGRTFIELSVELSPYVGRIDLMVSHAIFSKGVEVVANLFDNIYTTNSYYDPYDLPVGKHNITFVGGF